MITRGELRSRLRDAGTLLSVSEANRATHLAAIEAALSEVPAIAPLWRPRGLRRAAAVAVAVGILVLPGMAFASQHTVPGDLLYPVKKVAEWVWTVVDDDVVAEHRIDELEVLLSRHTEPTVLEKAVEAAVEASEGLPSDHYLHEDLAEILADFAASDPEDDPADEEYETEDHQTEEEGPLIDDDGEEGQTDGDADGP